MPIYRCNKCEFVSEDGTVGIGSKVNCARCGTPSTVYGTVFFIEKLAQRYFAALQEVKSLKLQLQPADASAMANSTTVGASQNAISSAESTLTNVDTLNTSLFATAEQHAPLKAWFAARHIEAVFDHSLVDTSGFFDDAAQLIGENFELFSNLIDRVCFAYRNSHSWINLELGKLSQKEAIAVNGLCRQLYEHTFFARYRYQKVEKIIGLKLQTAPAIRQFFNGGWLEWYALIEVVNQLKERGRTFSCARGVKVVFPNEDLHELDVLALVDSKSLICIECKSGEFRRDIEKYLRLCKRLGLERNRFIICAADLTDEQARGLSAMYQLTFVNLPSLSKHLNSLV
jgi:hypothetical protein